MGNAALGGLLLGTYHFALLVIPGAGHTSSGPYGDRKWIDVVVHHLIGLEPPDGNLRVATQASSTP